MHFIVQLAPFRYMSSGMIASIAVHLALWSHCAEGAFLGTAPEHAATQMRLVQVGKSGSASFVGAQPEERDGEEHDEVGGSGRNVVNHGKLARQMAKQNSAPVEEKYPFLYDCHDRLAIVFGKYAVYWYQDWKLWVGSAIWFAVWGKWLKFGYEEHFWVQAIFAFGINILILHHLQYAVTVKMAMAHVCALLTAQASFQSYMWSKSELTSVRATSKRQSVLSQEVTEEEFQCETMYLDFALPVDQVCVLFAAQCCISWFYMTYILANFNIETVNYTFWVVAYLAMQMTMIFCRGGDSALGKAFPSHDVFVLWMDANNIMFRLKDSDKPPFSVGRANIFLRGVTGFFCNSVLREILAYTIPLMLMSFTEPMDFVVYCVGVNFICTIDDTKDRTYTIVYQDMENSDSARGVGSLANSLAFGSPSAGKSTSTLSPGRSSSMSPAVPGV